MYKNTDKNESCYDCVYIITLKTFLYNEFHRNICIYYKNIYFLCDYKNTNYLDCSNYKKRRS